LFVKDGALAAVAAETAFVAAGTVVIKIKTDESAMTAASAIIKIFLLIFSGPPFRAVSENCSWCNF
jgi:hypothetical protein